MFETILVMFAAAGTAETVVTYIHSDALGSPVAETDEKGNVIARYVYEPYGKTLGDAPSDAPSYGGHVRDSQTDLYYMQQRYYSPETGGFLSVDPISAYGGKSAQFNRYRYANSNPYTFVDPDGRAAVVTRMKDNSVTISFPSSSRAQALRLRTLRPSNRRSPPCPELTTLEAVKPG